MRAYCSCIVMPKSQKMNQRLLDFNKFIESLDPSDSVKIAVAHEFFREKYGLKNLVFTICTYDNDTKAEIVYFNCEPGRKVYHASFDENGEPYIEVEDEE